MGEIKMSGYETFHVEIEQGDNKVHFAFNEFSDAKDFADTCMETCDMGSRVIFWENPE